MGGAESELQYAINTAVRCCGLPYLYGDVVERAEWVLPGWAPHSRFSTQLGRVRCAHYVYKMVDREILGNFFRAA